MRSTSQLRTLFASGRIAVAPGAYDGLSARLVAQAGFPAVKGFNAAIDRAFAYMDAGADMIFVEAPTSELEIAAIKAMQRVLAAIALDGSAAAMAADMVSFKEREALVDTAAYLDRGRLYAS